MRYAILSDVHANREALERVLKDATLCGAEAFVCLGDLVGYGPLPQETLSRLRATCTLIIAGNHDDAVSGRGDAESFIDLAGEAVERHRAALSSEELAWLKSLPYTASFGEALAVHGDLTDPARFFYIEDTADAEANFAATDTRLLFVGHTHIPGLFLTGHSGTVYHLAPQDFTLEDDKRYIVNPGSVGYPREANGECRSSYVIYDTDERTITFRFLPFSVASVMQRGRLPRPTRKVLAALITVTLLLVATALALVFRPTRAVVRTQTVTIDRSAALLLASRTLTLTPVVRFVRAHAVLARNSASAQLVVEFRDATGKRLDRAQETIRQKSTKRMSVPKGTLTVVFSISRFDERDDVRLESFAPSPDRQTDI